MRLRQMRNNADNVHMANYAAENLIHIYPHTEGKKMHRLWCFGSNVVINIVVDVFFKTSLSKKYDVLRDVLGFRKPWPTMPKMVGTFNININAYVI